ncbi:cytochrome c oxidase assembly factor Coa1 family protein [Stenotrophomonas sp. PD6]|uniref:cytochrome c oxidase assembly factor Coa1 family protein n=1 Tax=Stenotrophomonas sp. PD6 TaxID=3368612 RepID=UPI003BA0219C
MTLPPPLAGATRAGWWSRHWRWAMPLGVLALLLLAVALVWFVLAQWSRWSRASEPYQEAMRRARCSIELVAVLGEPIRDGYLPSGSQERTAGGGGSSEFVVSLTGPRGEAQLFLEAHRERGQWDYPLLYAITGNDEAIDLTALDDAEAATVCALRECREQGHCPLPGGRWGS